MKNISNNTIAAISTPIGEGGISIVRLSGKDSLMIADSIFCPSKKGELPSSCADNTVHHGHIKDPRTAEIADEVLLTVMHAPKTYTSEDVVEISCHGGIMSSKKILELCLGKGAALAEPGEFTRRAFLNGRIDLSQAEAVLDVIRSETDTSRKIAVRQLRGALSGEIRRLRSLIIDILSFIELTIDFSTEDVEFPSSENIRQRMNDVLCMVRKILRTFEAGIVLREGASVVICGRPNVGKSSLMNALLRHDRVIVTSVAGTTRDVVEESINIAGVKIRLSDTAGIIETQDRVEIEGIKRSRDKLSSADIVIFMLDRSRSFSVRDEEIYRILKDKRVVIVANKADLPPELDIGEAGKRFAVKEIVEVSALKKEGLEKIEDAIAEKLFKGNVGVPEGPVVTNIRHRKILEKAALSMERPMKVMDNNYNGELMASDLNEAVYQLGLIIGESVGDDVLDRIFSGFCVGK